MRHLFVTLTSPLDGAAVLVNVTRMRWCAAVVLNDQPMTAISFGDGVDGVITVRESVDEIRELIEVLT